MRSQQCLILKILNTASTPTSKPPKTWLLLSYFASVTTIFFSMCQICSPSPPPSTADLALRIKEVCNATMPWRYIYNSIEETIQHQHQGYGVSKPVIFHYVSNMIIALS